MWNRFLDAARPAPSRRIRRWWERSPADSRRNAVRYPNRDLPSLVMESPCCPTVEAGTGSRLPLHHTQRGDDMRLTRHRRWMAPVVAAAAVGLALTACTGDVAEEDAADVDCSDYEDVRHLRRRRGHGGRHDPRPRGRPAQRVVGRLRDLHGHLGRVPGLERVRGPDRGARRGRQRARRRLRAAARPDEPPRCGRLAHPGVRGRRGERRRVLVRGLEGVRHLRGHLLRGPAHGEHQGLRLVLAHGVRGEGLRDPEDPRRAEDALRHDRGRGRPQAVVRGPRVR